MKLEFSVGEINNWQVILLHAVTFNFVSMKFLGFHKNYNFVGT